MVRVTIGDLFEEIFGRERPPTFELALFTMAAIAGANEVNKRDEFGRYAGRKPTRADVAKWFEHGAQAFIDYAESEVEEAEKTGGTVGGKSAKPETETPPPRGEEDG